jgi:hypothetical protein
MLLEMLVLRNLQRCKIKCSLIFRIGSKGYLISKKYPAGVSVVKLKPLLNKKKRSNLYKAKRTSTFIKKYRIKVDHKKRNKFKY